MKTVLKNRPFYADGPEFERALLKTDQNWSKSWQISQMSSKWFKSLQKQLNLLDRALKCSRALSGNRCSERRTECHTANESGNNGFDLKRNDIWQVWYPARAVPRTPPWSNADIASRRTENRNCTILAPKSEFGAKITRHLLRGTWSSVRAQEW